MEIITSKNRFNNIIYIDNNIFDIIKRQFPEDKPKINIDIYTDCLGSYCQIGNFTNISTNKIINIANIHLPIFKNLDIFNYVISRITNVSDIIIGDCNKNNNKEIINNQFINIIDLDTLYLFLYKKDEFETLYLNKYLNNILYQSNFSIHPIIAISNTSEQKLNIERIKKSKINESLIMDEVSKYLYELYKQFFKQKIDETIPNIKIKTIKNTSYSILYRDIRLSSNESFEPLYFLLDKKIKESDNISNYDNLLYNELLKLVLLGIKNNFNFIIFSDYKNSCNKINNILKYSSYRAYIFYCKNNDKCLGIIYDSDKFSLNLIDSLKYNLQQEHIEEIYDIYTSNIDIRYNNLDIIQSSIYENKLIEYTTNNIVNYCQIGIFNIKNSDKQISIANVFYDNLDTSQEYNSEIIKRTNYNNNSFNIIIGNLKTNYYDECKEMQISDNSKPEYKIIVEINKSNKKTLRYVTSSDEVKYQVKYPDLFSLFHDTSKLELHQNIVLYHDKYYLNKIFNFNEIEKNTEIIETGNYCKNFFHSIYFTEKQ